MSGFRKLTARILGVDDDSSGLIPQTRAAASEAEVHALRNRVAELEAQINTPETGDFLKGVCLEAAHQRERWGAQHDTGKSAFDWFWLIGYLAQKAASAEVAGDIEKARHHTISTAAALSNWHLRLSQAEGGRVNAAEKWMGRRS